MLNFHHMAGFPDRITYGNFKGTGVYVINILNLNNGTIL